MVTITELLERNKKVAATHTPLPRLADGIPKPAVIVVSCADSRCNPSHILDLEFGDTAVLRTAGGRVRQVMNDILALDGFIGIKELMIIHHTDCGGTYFTDESIHEKLRERAPEAAQEVKDITFGTFTDVTASVKEDLAIVRASKLMRKELVDNTHGYVYDIKTGLMERVDA